MMLTSLLIFAIAALASGAASFYLLRGGALLDPSIVQKTLEEAEKEAKRTREESKIKLEEIQRAMEEEERSTEESLKKMEEILGQKEEILKRKEERNKGNAEQVHSLEAAVKKLNEAYQVSVKRIREGLSQQSGLSEEKALDLARAGLTKLIQQDAEKRKNVVLEEIEEDAPRHAKAILQVVIQRLGVPSSVDKNTTSVTVKEDKFKGLLIGKNGVNVQFLESLLPVSIIFNLGDPETIHVGGVNLLRRNIAKRAIEKLQTEVKQSRKGSQTPGRLDQEMIKNAVSAAEKEIMEFCDRKGQESLQLLHLDPQKIPRELNNYVGRLYYRTSYGQNITAHSNEMALAARMLAELIGANSDGAMQAAFYHDIGKAIDHDVGGAHDDLSKEILEKYGFEPGIVHAAYAHHDKVSCESPEDFIVKAVDAISGGRPGARQESVTNYFERIQKLEETALSFEGISKVYTMSAGREVRVLVDKDKIQDEGMQVLADQMAGKISEEVAFPGIIKVNLIRVTKAVDYARERPGPPRRPSAFKH